MAGAAPTLTAGGVAVRRARRLEAGGGRAAGTPEGHTASGTDRNHTSGIEGRGEEAVAEAIPVGRGISRPLCPKRKHGGTGSSRGAGSIPHTGCRAPASEPKRLRMRRPGSDAPPGAAVSIVAALERSACARTGTGPALLRRHPTGAERRRDAALGCAAGAGAPSRATGIAGDAAGRRAAPINAAAAWRRRASHGRRLG